MLFMVTASLIPTRSYADTPLNIQITQAGDGTSTYSGSLKMQLKVSGGNSTKYSTCDAFFKGNQDIRIGLTADNKEGRVQDRISGFAVKTLEINATTLSCEFLLAPMANFNFSDNMITLPTNLIIKILNDSTLFDQKTIRMLDESTIQPTISILNPLRGSNVAGEFIVNTKIENSTLWKPDTTMAGAFVGASPSCYLPVGNFKISALNTPNRTSVSANQYTGSNKQMIVTQQSTNSFRFQFFEPGQYTICIWQSFTATNDTNIKSNNGDWVTAAVVVNVSSAVSNLTYDYNDPIFKKLWGSPYNFIFKCPSNVSSTSKNYECSVQAQSKITQSDLKDLGLTSGTTVKITGSIPLLICELDRDQYGMACGNSAATVPDYFAAKYTINVGFDTPVKFKVNNYLSKTGYTGVVIDGNIEQGDPDSSYAWKMNDYDVKKRKAANAPPSTSYQAAISKAIQSSMSSKCQKLPSSFSKYSIKYSKKITSYDGFPGYIFVINGKTNIQIFEMGNSWQFGPSSATSDQKTWKAWGCGGAIWVY